MNVAMNKMLKRRKGMVIRSLIRMRNMSRRLRVLDKRIAEIEGNDKPVKSGSVILFIISLFLLFASGLVVYTCAYSKKIDFLADYFSYVCPAMAALFAGLGLYLRNDRFWYVFSGVLVFIGSISYLYTKPGFVLVLIVFSCFFELMYGSVVIVLTKRNARSGDFLVAYRSKKVCYF